jgi:hypothetical protein
MCQNIPEEIGGNLLPMKSKSAYEKVYSYVSFQGRNNKTEVTEDVILVFLDMG